MKISELYEAIFDPEKYLQMKKVKVDQYGVCGDYGYQYDSDWITITKDDMLTTFLGHCLPAGTQVGGEDAFRVLSHDDHDGKIVDLHGKKYLLTELKENFNGEENE